MRAAKILASAILVCACVGAGVFLAQPPPGGLAFHATPVEQVLSVLVGTAALASLILACTRSVGGRLGLSIGLFAVSDLLLVAHLGGRWPLPCDPFRDGRYVAFLALVQAAAIYGLARRRLWARWLGLAFGSFGALSSGINAVHFVTAGVRDDWTWMFLAFGIGSLIVGLQLADARVADDLAARARTDVWRSTDPLVRVTRAATICALAAVSMLLVYAWLQPFVPSTASAALALAAVLGTGAILVVLRKTAGGLVLGAGGVGLLALTAVTASRGAAHPDLVGYYAVFWLPAALSGVACGTMILWRATKLR